MSRCDVAIVGIACRFPQACDARRFWTNVRDGVDAIGDLPADRWRAEDYFDADPLAPDRTYARRGGFLDPVEFDPMAFGIAPRDLEAIDTTQLLGLVVAREALDDAGYGASGRTFDRSRCSVLLGVTGTLELVIPLGARLGHPIWRRALADAGVSAPVAADVVDRISSAYVPWQENSFPGLLGNVVAGRIANRLDLHGTNCVVDAACASSLGALHLAMMELETGRADMVISGGLDTFNDIFMYVCFSKTPALSPTGDARPFSANADGTILGEGIGIVVLKRVEDAQRDGDRIYAVIRGIGRASDGRGQAIYTPSVDGQVRTLEDAYARAGVDPTSVGLVEGHGTGTRVGDAIEVEALSRVFGRDGGRQRCALGSVKSMIGHTKAAAGVAGLIKTALALHHRTLPPTLKVAVAAEALGPSPFYLSATKRPWFEHPEAPRRAGVSAFGFGGSNFHVVLEEWSADQPDVDWNDDVEIYLASGQSAAEIVPRTAALPLGDWDSLRSYCKHSRENFDRSAAIRFGLVLERGTDTALLHGRALAALERQEPFWIPEGAACEFGKAAGGLALLFPGQGAQAPGMMADLACAFSSFPTTFREAETAAGGSPGLADLVYPAPAADADQARSQAAALTATEVAQPALAAVELAALRMIQRFDLRFDATAGHSFGELVALTAAGVIDPESLHRLARVRGRLMAGEGGGDRGAMAAVRADRATISALLSEHRLQLTVANRNAPRQAVLSGGRESIERAIEVFSNAGIAALRLDVGAAFHSPLVADARGPLGDVLQGVIFSPPRARVWSNTTGRVYPDDPEAQRAVLASQLAEPVEFVAMIEDMAASGIRTFVEIGPGRRLTGLVRDIFGDRKDVRVIALEDRSVGSSIAGLARMLLGVAVRGHAVDLSSWGRSARNLAPVADQTPRGPTFRIGGPNLHRATPPRAPASPVPEPVVQSAAPLSSDEGVILQLLELQRRTADLHREFLESQAAVVKVIAGMMGNGEPVPVAQHAFAISPISVSPVPVLDLPVVHVPVMPVISSGSGGEPILECILKVISDKTGYPVSAISPAMSLELDLGVDSIKRVEIAAAVSELLCPVDPPTSDTLARAGTPLALAEAFAPRPGAQTAAASDAIANRVCSIIAEKTGYPAEMIELGMELEADLGIDSIKRVEIFARLHEVIPASTMSAADAGGLRTVGEIVLAFSSGPLGVVDHRPSQATSAPAETVEGVLRMIPTLREVAIHPGMPPRGEIVVVGDHLVDCELLAAALRRVGMTASAVGIFDQAILNEVVGGLILVAACKTDARSLAAALGWARRCAPSLRASGGLFASVARLDGAFGWATGVEVEAAAGAGLAGLVKTAGLEWPEVRTRALDVDPNYLDPWDQVAACLLAEGPVELAVTENSVREIVLEPRSTVDGPRFRIGGNDVVLISGGARGVAAAVAIEWAGEGQAHFVLMGRSPAPHDEPDWARALMDEAALKHGFAARHPSTSPREIERFWRELTAAREIRDTLERIRAKGATAEYRILDVRDAAGVREIVAEVRPTLVVHAAGVLADRNIVDKREGDFDEVYGTKVGGLQNFIAALDLSTLRALVLFSSSTARFGRVGQADYAMANEVLCKLASGLHHRHPHLRVVAACWGPIEGGMVTPALARLFRAEGLPPLPLSSAAPALWSELAVGQEHEVVLLAKGSVLPTAIVAPNPTLVSVVGPASASVELPTVFDRTLDATLDRVLADHVLDGRSVFPLAMCVEWMAHAALHGNPGLQFAGIDDARVLRGILIDSGSSLRLRGCAGRASLQEDGSFAVPVQLCSGGGNGHRVVHATGSVRLAATPDTPSQTRAPMPSFGLYSGEIAAAYAQHLFHGPLLQGITAIEGVGEAGIVAVLRAPSAPSEWTNTPLRGQWIADPLALDCGFQLVILHHREFGGDRSLPTHMGRFRQYSSFQTGPCRVVVRVVERAPHRSVCDIEWSTLDGQPVARLDGYECVVDRSLDRAFSRNRLAVATALAGS